MKYIILFLIIAINAGCRPKGGEMEIEPLLYMPEEIA